MALCMVKSAVAILSSLRIHPIRFESSWLTLEFFPAWKKSKKDFIFFFFDLLLLE